MRVSLCGLTPSCVCGPLWTYKRYGEGTVFLIHADTPSRGFVGNKVGDAYGCIADPKLPAGAAFRLTDPRPDGTAEVVVEGSTIASCIGGTTEPLIRREQNMTGQVYEGVVVKTTQVPAGEGLTSSVAKSEIVLTVPPFIAKDAGTAQGVVMAKAIGEGHDLNDPTEVIEVKLKVYGS